MRWREENGVSNNVLRPPGVGGEHGADWMHTNAGNDAALEQTDSRDPSLPCLYHHGILHSKARLALPRKLGKEGDQNNWCRTVEFLELPGEPGDPYDWYIIERRAQASLHIAWMDYNRRRESRNRDKLVRHRREFENAGRVNTEEMRRLEILNERYYDKDPADPRNTASLRKINTLLESLRVSEHTVNQRADSNYKRTTAACKYLQTVLKENQVRLALAREDCFKAQNIQLRDQADGAFIRDVIDDVRDRRHEFDHGSYRPEYLHHAVLVPTELIAKARADECSAKTAHAAIRIPATANMDSPVWETYEKSVCTTGKRNASYRS